MHWLTQLCIKRPVLAWVLILLVVVFGAVGYARLGVDEFPNIDIPVVVVTTRLPGASAESIESDVTDPIERAVNTLGGIEELSSTSSEGISQVVISFVIDRDPDAAAQDVRDRVNVLLRSLPEGTEVPVVSKIDPAALPVVLIALQGDVSPRALTDIADHRVRPAIESIAGVGEVTLTGGRERTIQVRLDPLRLRAHDVTASEVAQALSRQNLSAPGGHVETGRVDLSVRLDGRVTDARAVRDLVVRADADRAITVGDVATVVDGEAEATSIATLNDDDVVLLAVRKQVGRNTVAVVDDVVARLDAIRAELPRGTTLEVVRDNSATIRTGTSAVLEHLVVGALLAALVVLLFLGDVRSTVIAALAIPVSIIGTFAVMWQQDFTLNVLTLLALALSVGIVIDDAIVVLENVVRYVQEKGVKPFPAAVLATREIGPAVLATTLSLMAVFLPVGLLGGVIGRFLSHFGFTMAFAIGVSMLVSFTLTPMLAARWLDPSRDAAPSRAARLTERFYAPIERAYMAVLRFALRRRLVVVLVSIAALVATSPIAARIPMGFTPADDQAQFQINVRAPEGTSLAETRLIVERIAYDTRALPGVTKTLMTVGGDARETANLASVLVYLTDPSVRSTAQATLIDRVRREILPRHPRTLRTSVTPVDQISTGGPTAEVSFALTGPDLDVLAQHAAHITERVRRIPGAVDVDNTLVLGKPTLDLTIDRARAADLGVQVADVAEALRYFLVGETVSSFIDDGKAYDIRVRADAATRSSTDALALLTVRSSDGASIPLASVVDVRSRRAPSAIDRKGRVRQVTITANAAPGFGASEIAEEVTRIAGEEHMPGGYTLGASGDTRETEKLVGGFLTVIGLAFVFMYLVLAAQFSSWLHPFTILLALPLTVPFAMLSLLLLGQSFNLFSALGLLVLFGVVKKNAILQIDHTNHLRAGGMERTAALLAANKERLRPILMTTLAFVVGMIPLLVSRGIGSGFNQSMAGIVLGGQTLSLLLTLVAVPVAYSLFDDVGAFFSRRLTAKRRRVDRGEAEIAAMMLGVLVLVVPSMHARAMPSLEELVAAGEHHAVDVRLADAEIDARSASHHVARASMLPNVTAVGTYYRNQYDITADLPDGAGGTQRIVLNPSNQLNGTFSLSLPLVDLAAFDTIRATRVERDASYADRAGVRLDVRRRVTRAYYTMLGYDAITLAARDAERVAHANVAYVRVHFDAGRATPLEMERAEAELAARTADVAVAERERRSARRELWTLTDIRVADDDVTTLDVALDPGGAIAPYLERLAETPSVRAEAARLVAAEARARAARRASLPTLTAVAQEQVTNAAGFGQASQWQIQLVARMRLGFDEAAQIALTRAERTSAELRLERAEIEVRRAIESAFDDVETNRARALAAAAREGATRRAAESAHVRYEAGTATQLDVLQADRDVFAARVERVRAEAELLYAREALEIVSMAVGEALDETPAP